MNNEKKIKRLEKELAATKERLEKARATLRRVPSKFKL